MKKLKMDNPTDWSKFVGTLIIMSLLGTLGIAGLERVFGIVTIFVGAVTITVIAAIYVIVLQIRKHLDRKEDNWIQAKKKTLTKYINRNDD